MKVTVILFLSFFTTSVFSETYVCSHELSKYGRLGEIETVQFERVGKKFVNGRWEYEVVENNSVLILIDTSFRTESVDVVLIDKETKSWERGYMSVSEIGTSKKGTDHGKCLVVN